MGNISDPMVVMTDCICPMCRGRHKAKLFWTGNGIPRIFCLDCKNTKSVMTGNYEYQKVQGLPKTFANAVLK